MLGNCLGFLGGGILGDSCEHYLAIPGDCFHCPSARRRKRRRRTRRMKRRMKKKTNRRRKMEKRTSKRKRRKRSKRKRRRRRRKRTRRKIRGAHRCGSVGRVQLTSNRNQEIQSSLLINRLSMSLSSSLSLPLLPCVTPLDAQLDALLTALLNALLDALVANLQQNKKNKNNKRKKILFLFFSFFFLFLSFFFFFNIKMSNETWIRLASDGGCFNSSASDRAGWRWRRWRWRWWRWRGAVDGAALGLIRLWSRVDYFTGDIQRSGWVGRNMAADTFIWARELSQVDA